MSRQTADELRRGLDAVLCRVERLRSPLRSQDVKDIADAARDWAFGAQAATTAADGAAAPTLSGDRPALARCGLALQPCDLNIRLSVHLCG